MNRLLQVKMPFTSEKNTKTPVSRNLRKGNETSVEKIDKLSADLKAVLLYYKGIPKIIDNIIMMLITMISLQNLTELWIYLSQQGKVRMIW